MTLQFGIGFDVTTPVVKVIELWKELFKNFGACLASIIDAMYLTVAALSIASKVASEMGVGGIGSPAVKTI